MTDALPDQTRTDPTGPDPIAAPPDWSTLKEDLLCPLCEYNLHGLTESRCPECGYTFAWDEIRDPTRRRHPYLFEHATQNRFRSFMRTALATWRPRRFWNELHPTQPSAPKRIVHYWLIGVGVYLAGIAILLFASGVAWLAEQNRFRAEVISFYKANPLSPKVQGIVQRYGSIEAYVDIVQPVQGFKEWLEYCWETGMSEIGFLLFVFVPLSWPWLTIASLMIFRISMRRAKIANTHVLRCVLYSFDLLFWMGALTILLSVSSTLIAGSLPQESAEYFFIWMGYQFPAVLLIASYRLWWAYRRYLRFKHAFGTVLASQIIVFLFLLNTLAIISQA